MQCRALLVAILSTVACGAQSAQSVVAIPRYVGPPDTGSGRYVRGMNYDPFDVALSWSPGATLVVAHFEHYSYADVASSTCSGSGLFVIQLGAGSVRRLAVGEPFCSEFVGGYGMALRSTSGFAFSSIRVPVNRSQLVRMRLPVGPVDTIPTRCVYAEDPDVSPDGARLAFRGLCEDRQQEHWEIYTVGPNGVGLHQLSEESGYDAGTPRWSADGRQLAYVRTRATTRDHAEEIAVIDSSGSGRRILARGSEPAWSADGSWVAYIHTDQVRELPGSIRIVHPDGSGDHEVFRNRERSTYSRGWGPMLEGQPSGRLVWSPDAHWIAFSRAYEHGTSIWRVDVQTGDSHPVTRPDR